MANAAILNKLLAKLNLTPYQFEKEIGASRARISNAISRDSRITGDIVDLIVSKYPKVNRLWLQTGEGDMFTEPRKPMTGGQWQDTKDYSFTEGDVKTRNRSKLKNKQAEQEQSEFDMIVNRHYARFDALENTLTKEQKFAYRHLYNNVAPEKMWVYVLANLDKK